MVGKRSNKFNEKKKHKIYTSLVLPTIIIFDQTKLLLPTCIDCKTLSRQVFIFLFKSFILR